MNLQQRNRNQAAALRNILFISRTRDHDIQIRVGGGSNALTLRIWQGTHKIGTLQSGSSPEVPAVGATRKIAELNIGLCGRFKNAAFPPRNGHGGTTEPAAEF